MIFLATILHFHQPGDVCMKQAWIFVFPLCLFAQIERAEVGAPPVQKQVEHSMSFVFDQFPAIDKAVPSHLLVQVADEQKSVELSDGSVWTVSLFDRYKIKTWSTNHCIHVTQNTRWFSSNRYRLINEQLGDVVEVALAEGPWLESANAIKIKYIDLKTKTVELIDGRKLSVAESDAVSLASWHIADSLILGFNSGFDRKHETLIVHVASNTFVQAHKK